MDISSKDWHIWETPRNCFYPNGYFSPPPPPKRQRLITSTPNYSQVVRRVKLVPSTSTFPVRLLHRELGIYKSSNFTNRMMRELIKTRSPADPNPVEVETHTLPSIVSLYQPPHNNAPGRGQWFHAIGDSSTFEFINEFIVVHDGDGLRRFILPSVPLLPNPFTVKFVIDSSNKWWDFNCRYINMTNPEMASLRPGGMKKVVKLPNMILVLEGLTLVAYDAANNGKKLDELSLKYPHGADYFHWLGVDHSSMEDRIYISNDNDRGRMVLECLVVTFPPLKLLYRLIVPHRGVFVGTSVSVFGDLMMVSSASGIEIFDLMDVTKININPHQEMVHSLDGTHVQTTVYVANKPPKPMFRFKPEPGLSEHFQVIHSSSPPLICVRVKDYYRILPLVKNVNEKMNGIGNLSAKTRYGKDLEIKLYDSTRPRILVSGFDHGFHVLHVDARNKVIHRLYSTENFPVPPPLGIPSTRKFGFCLDSDLDLLAICLVEDGVLHTTIYDNNTFQCFKKLTPVKLKDPIGSKCCNVVVNFNEWYLAVLLTLTNEGNEGMMSTTFQEIYTANLFGEVVPNN